MGSATAVPTEPPATRTSQCPKCRKRYDARRASCPACASGRVPGCGERKPAASARPERTRPAGPSPLRRILGLLALGLGGGGAVVVAYYAIEIRPRLAAISGAPAAPRAITSMATTGAGLHGDFELSVKLPGSPSGLVPDGAKGFIAANRVDPWGLLRIVPVEGGYRVTRQPLLEPVYNQRIGLDFVTRDDKGLIGYTTGSWFQRSEDRVFTRHDPATLSVTTTVPAPPRLGAMVWDGSGFWAATRNNTASSGEPRQILRLDPELQVVRTLAAPTVGCQGLAWDGEFLWAVDVFEDALFQLRPRESDVEVVARHPLGTTYPSGLAFVGGELWLAEYDQNAIHRLRGALVSGVRGGDVEASLPAPPPEPLVERVPDPSTAAGAAEVVAGLRAGTLRLDEARARLAATGREKELLPYLRERIWEDEMALFERQLYRELGGKQDRARRTDRFAKTGREDTDCLALEVWIEGDELRASWRVHVGQDLLPRPGVEQKGNVTMPLFARYRLSVKGGTLAQEVEREFDAVGGENVRTGERLASGLGPGTYQASVFIHVQYIKPDGGNMILNDSAGWLEVEK